MVEPSCSFQLKQLIETWQDGRHIRGERSIWSNGMCRPNVLFCLALYGQRIYYTRGGVRTSGRTLAKRVSGGQLYGHPTHCKQYNLKKTKFSILAR